MKPFFVLAFWQRCFVHSARNSSSVKRQRWWERKNKLRKNLILKEEIAAGGIVYGIWLRKKNSLVVDRCSAWLDCNYILLHGISSCCKGQFLFKVKPNLICVSGHCKYGKRQQVCSNMMDDTHIHCKRNYGYILKSNILGEKIIALLKMSYSFMITLEQVAHLMYRVKVALL